MYGPSGHDIKFQLALVYIGVSALSIFDFESFDNFLSHIIIWAGNKTMDSVS